MNKTQALFYRRLYVAHLIATGTDTVPKIMFETGMPRRTVQDVIKGLADLNVTCEYQGATKAGSYVITDWGPINAEWIIKHLRHVRDVHNER